MGNGSSNRKAQSWRQAHPCAATSLRDERFLTATITLVASLALNAGGLLLFLASGIGVLFGGVLCFFGVTGCIQALVIATGHGHPSDRATKRSAGPR